MRYEIKNILFGAETSVNQLPFETITDLEGKETLSTEVKYDTSEPSVLAQLTDLKENDKAYFLTVTVILKSLIEGIADTQATLRIVSFNSMTGFEVDKQRDKYISDWFELINK